MAGESSISGAQWARIPFVSGAATLRDLSPNLSYQIELCDLGIATPGILFAYSSANADGSSPDVTSYVWAFRGNSSSSTSQANLVQTNPIDFTGWALLQTADLPWSRINGNLTYRPGNCALKWNLGGETNGFAAEVSGFGFRLATNRRSLVLGALTTGFVVVPVTGTAYYRPVGG